MWQNGILVKLTKTSFLQIYATWHAMVNKR